MKDIAAIWMLLTACAVAGCQGPEGADLFDSRTPEPVDPEGYTIRLSVFTGPHHVADSNRSKRATGELTGWKGLFVVHERSGSTLYRGHYATLASARKDQAVVRRWATPAKLRPFQLATIVRRTGHGPGPREWDLARTAGAYTVVIGMFYNDPKAGFRGRKRYAVANCRDLRAKDHEAYYFHGPAKSLVTIGSFPITAFKMVQLPNGAVRAVMNDERMKKIMKEFPYLAVNGYQEIIRAVNPQTGKVEERITATYVTGVPGNPSRPRPSRTDRAGHPQPG